MKNRTRIRLLLAAGASLGAIATTPALAQDATWSLTPENVVFGSRSDYQDPNNWVPATVPTGTATFGQTIETDIFFENQVNQQPIEIGRFVFDLNAPAYTFSLQTDELTFTGEGIVVNSSATQTLISGNRSTLRFANSSSAGTAALLANGNTGSIRFENMSTAGQATITVGQVVGNDFSAGGLQFFDDATAGMATITNPAGSIIFWENSSGGDATINNLNLTTFRDTASIGNATIVNDGLVRMFISSDGPDGTIVNNAGAVVDISAALADAPAASVSIGSLSGAGDVRLGARILVLGGLDLSETIGGVISDGGDAAGTGGSLSKIGTGTLTLTGDSTYTGDTTVNGGTLLLTGSITGSDETLVGSGTGTVGVLTIRSGATLTSTGDAAIGQDAGNGTVTVTGADSAWTIGGGLTVGVLGGNGGVGRLNIEDGATVTTIGGSGIVFRTLLPATDGRVFVTGTGSVWNSGNLLVQGPGGTDLLTISAGGTVNSGPVNLAGAVLATGSGSTWNTGHLIVGPNLSANGNPAGRLRIVAGAVVDSASAVIGEGGSFTSSVIIDGAGSAWNVGSDLVLSPTAAFSGEVIVLNGGTLTVEGGTGTIEVGPNGGASFFIVGGGAPGTLPGTVEAAGMLVGSGSFLAFDHEANNHIFELPISGSGEILVGRGTTILTADSVDFAGTTTIFSGATLQLGDGGSSGSIGGDITNDAALVIDRSGTLTLAGIISGTGTFAQDGTVTTTLTGANTYTGTTDIHGGTLLVDGSIADSAVNVNDGATLGGNGTVGDTTIADGGTIAPGDSIGVLSVTGDLAFAAAGNYQAEVSPTTADLIDVTGTATLDGLLTAIATGGTYSPGEFTLLTADGGRSGMFDDLQTQGSFGGLSAVLSYDANNVVLTLAVSDGTPDWTGATSTDWFINGNWDNNTVPTATTNATINTITPNPTIVASAGAVTADILIGGAGGTGNLTVQSGGTLATGGDATIGEGGGVGEVRVTGVGSTWTIEGTMLFAGPSQSIGTSGTLRIDAGASVSSNGVSLNQFETRSSRAIVSGSGTVWNTGGFVANGKANLVGDLVTVEGGATVTSTTSDMFSRMTVSGTGTLWNSGDLNVGSSSGINPSRLTIAAGATVNSSTALLGFNLGAAGSTGIVDVTAASWNVGADLGIGESATTTGVVIVRDAGNITIASGAGAALVGPNSTLTIGGSALVAPGSLTAAEVDLAADARLVFSHNSEGYAFAPLITGAGDVEVTLGTTILTADNNGFTGTVTIGEVIPDVGRGGVLQLGDGGATGSIGGDIVNDNQLVIDRTGILTVDGIISGTGSLTQNGSVATTLTAANTYTGATIVNGGTLQVDGSIAASALTVHDGATLGGTGTVGATTVADGGIIAPGNSIGTLNVGGNLSFASDSLFRVEVAPAAADLLAVTGSAALAGTLDAVETGGTYAAGQQYTVLTAGGGITGAFGAITIQGDFSGLEAELGYDANNVFLILSRAGPTSTVTAQQTDAIIFNAPTIVVERISLNETRIIGRLAGGVALFDETINDAFSSATVQNALRAARLAITSGGGPGVVVLVSDPVLVGRNVTTATTSASTFTLAGMTDTVTTTTTFGGPGVTVTIGDARSCGAAVAALPSGTAPACGDPAGQSFDVAPGTVNVNTETHTEYVVDELRTDTITETISETWELTGTIVPVGTVHAAALSGIYDLAGRLLQRIGQEGAPGLFGESALIETSASNLVSAGGGRGWAEGYGFRTRADARGGLPAERRDAQGFAAGLSHEVGEGLVLGFGVDQGWLDLDVPEAMETADIELTQFALGARFGRGPFSVAMSASYGFGSVDSTSSLIAVSTASYDVDVIGLFAEASYTFEAGAWRLVPKAAIDHVRIDSEAFSGSGMFGLAVRSYDSDRTRLVPGFEFGRSFPLGDRGGALDLSGSFHYVAVIGGEERTLPVAFTIAPGTPLVMRGLSERDSALIGAQARLRLSPTLDLYLAYDGRFAGGYDAHGGTVGFKLVW